MALRAFIVAMLLSVVFVAAGCKGDGHTDHEHATPVAPAR